ncbi:MAG: polyprenyl synthetase family protein [Zetaproteobacteria bacterium]|nr:MAG: polyprenyl synthetase family protein [Zetaproteobacteria bacterium]
MGGVAAHDGLFAVISDEMQGVEDRLRGPVEGNGALLSTVARYALASGGKRIRPALLLLAARACGVGGGARAVTLASATEMMHAATLLHDDIVDHAATRRGRPSAMARWGADVSVLVGDFLYSRAIQDLVADEDRRILSAFADATVAMTEAEVLQLQLLHDLRIGEADYLKIVTGKTAALMSAACRAGALVAAACDATVEALGSFGLNLGIGFQLVDDALDYVAREDRLGKPVGKDFREGKITYPVIHVMRHAVPADSRRLEWLANQDRPRDDGLDMLREMVDRYEAVPATMRLVDRYLADARAQLRCLPESAARDALERLVDFVRERDW